MPAPPMATHEAATRIDIGSFVESLAYDYQDTGKDVTVSAQHQRHRHGPPPRAAPHPHQLDRQRAEVRRHRRAGASRARAEGVLISVLDRGPGIPEDQLEAVMQPFFRLEHSRSRDTGGTGLGLAIAQQLAQAIGGSLKLRNREGGGLAAEVRIG